MSGCLIYGNPDLNIRAGGFARLGAGQKRTGTSRVVTRTVTIGSSMMLSQTSEYGDVLPQRGERFERLRQFPIRSIAFGFPIRHNRAIGKKDVSRTNGDC